MAPPVIIALVVILLFGIMGYRDGVVKRVLEIVGVLASLVLTARFATSVQPWLAERTSIDEGPALLVTWAGLFLAGLLLSRVLATLISKTLRLTVLGWLDKTGGAVVGMALGTLVASVLLVALSQVPGGDKVQASCQREAVGRFIFYAAPSFYEQARKLSGGRVEDVWHRVLDGAKEKAEDARDKLDEAADRSGQG